MRKLLLLGLAMGLGTITMAQNAANSGRKADASFRNVEMHASQDAMPMANPVIREKPNVPKGISDVEPIELFSSLNVYTLLVSEQTCMTYNQDIDAIMFIARGHTGYVGTGNTVNTAISTDGGQTFEAAVSVNPPTEGNNRYPSGAIYNPAGNTDPANAYKVFTAPITGGSGWLGNNYATCKWDNSSPVNQFIQTNGNDMLVRGGLDVDVNGYAHTLGLEYATGVVDAKGYIFRGVFNAATGGYEFSSQLLETPFVLNSTGGAAQVQATGNVAFSPDGSIGYAMFLAADNRALDGLPTGPQPIVYKTTDMGATWELMPMLNFENHPMFQTYLFPLRRTWGSANEIFKPNFWEGDMVVDYNGDLHIMAKVLGTYSDHIDSLTYYYSVETGHIFEIYNVLQGNDWHVRYIDSLRTLYVRSDESGYGSGSDAVGWDHRTQASRSSDGKAVFAIWTDTDKEFFGVENNAYPDVKGWGHKVDEGLFTEVIDFTNQGATYGENYFMFVSPTAIDKGDGTYEVPASKSDIWTTGDPGQPVYHSYLKGIVFSDFPYGVGVNELANVKEIEAYPNPVSETLTIEVTLNKAADMTVEMTNILGQSVYSNTAKANAGLNTRNVNVANMQAGIYFYSVVVDGKKSTNKVVVR